jgi:hypothetical protein
MMMENFFDRAREYIQNIIKDERVIVDLIYLKGSRQGVTFTHPTSTPSQREKTINLDSQSLLKSYIQTATSRRQYTINGVPERSHFNI